MKKRNIILLGVSMLSVAACTRVEPGHVGVKVNRYGSEAGVQPEPLGVGTYQTAFGVDVYEYPIFINNYVWQRAEDRNEELTFQDKNGLIVSGDVNVAYRVNPAMAPKLFQTYRVGMEGIVAGPLRNRVRSALVAAASDMTVEEIYGPKKSILIGKALKQVHDYFAPLGLNVDQLDWAGPIRIPDNIMERINANAQSEQAAIAAEAEARANTARGKAAVTKAEAEAKVKVLRAEADAASIKARNSAVALNPGYQNEWVRKWDGQLPKTVYCSSANPCVTVQGQ